MWSSVFNLLASVASVLALRGQGDLAEVVRLVSLLLRETGDASNELDKLTAKLETMVAEGRGPTPEEAAVVRAKREALSSEIRNVDLGDS